MTRVAFPLLLALVVGCAAGGHDRDDEEPADVMADGESGSDDDDLPGPGVDAGDGASDEPSDCTGSTCAPTEPGAAACTHDDACAEGLCDVASGTCVVASTCAELHERAPLRQSGTYPIDPDLDGPEPPLAAYCDMTTDGGGWTILYASDGRDGNVPITSHTVVEGNPLAFEHYNLHSLDKIRVASLSSEMLVRRPGPAWLVADAAPFTPEILTPTSEGYAAVMLRAADGSSANGWVGWANYNISGGGDFGITTTDGQTCEGWVTTLGFDHHNPSFWNLNCGCTRHYLYSMSSDVADGDAAYHAAMGLGGWTATAACTGTEGAGDPLFVAVR